MKTIKQLIIGAVAALVLAAGSAFALGPEATSQYVTWVPFNTTNLLTGGTTLTSYPTNTGTYAGLSTGGGVFIGDTDILTLHVGGFLTNTSGTNIINVTFVTATPINGGGGAPVFGATATNVSDWSWNSNTIAIPLPVWTNWFNYETNILINTATSIPNSGYLGISQIQPLGSTLTLSWVATNGINSPTNTGGEFYIERKVKPVHTQ